MASERAMVFGFCGSKRCASAFTAVGDRASSRSPGRRRILTGLVFDQAELDEFVERFVDLADQRAAGHRDDDVVGQPPAELLGDLVSRASWSLRRSRGAG